MKIVRILTLLLQIFLVCSKLRMTFIIKISLGGSKKVSKSEVLCKTATSEGNCHSLPSRVREGKLYASAVKYETNNHYFNAKYVFTRIFMVEGYVKNYRFFTETEEKIQFGIIYNFLNSIYCSIV